MANVLTVKRALRLTQGDRVKIDLSKHGIQVRTYVGGHVREDHKPAVPGRFLFGTIVNSQPAKEALLVRLYGGKRRVVTVDPRRHDVSVHFGDFSALQDEEGVEAAQGAEDRLKGES